MNAVGFDLRTELFQRDNPLQKLGFYVLLAYFFVAYSRILDMVGPGLHLPMIMAVVMYATTIAVGGIQRSLSSKPGIFFFLITGWMCFSILLTPWKGNAVDTLLNNWLKTFPLYLAVMATIYRTQQVQKCLNLVAFALTITCAIAVVKGNTMSDGRLVISGTKFGDPNDLALFCNFALVCWFSLWSVTESWVKRLMMLPCMGIILIAFLKTGSRGGLLGLAVVLVYIFFRTSMTRRMLMIGAVSVGALLLTVVAGRAIQDRFFTFMNSDETASDDAAAGSTQSRIYLVKKSIEVTLMNPLAGVGPGNFMFAENEIAQSSGASHGAWHQTHNMYTQVSSELGLPGLFLYLGIMVVTWMSLNRVEKFLARSHPESLRVQNAAFWLKALFIAFASSGTFLSVAYQDILPVVAGLGVTLERAVVAETFLAGKAVAAVQQPKATPPGARWRRPAFVLNRARSLPGLPQA